LLTQGRTREAETAFRERCAADPGDADAWLGLGRALDRQNKLAEATDAVRQASELAPASGEAQRFLGACKLRGGRLLEALDCFRRAVALEPAVAMNHTALAMAHQQLNEHAPALHHLEQAVALAPRSAAIFSAYLFELSHHPGLSPAHVFAEHVRYGRTFGGRADRFRHDNSPDPHRRLRIGYVSGDFYQHSAMLFLLPVLTRHDSRHYETFAYSNVFRPDQVTETIKGAVAHWRPIHGLSDDAAAALVHADRIDILVDLSGHTDSNRLPVFARKPVPVQVTWLGYPATTGLAEIDYRLVNSATSPDRAAFFTERLYRMAGASTCFNFPADTPAPASPPALANGFITFGSFSAPRKMSREIIAVWAAIMHEVPGSRLFLKYAGLGEAERRRWFVETFGSLGIGADRLQFADYSPYAEHLRAYDRVDVALDPFPYPGGTTTRNALWCGVPVITLDARTASPTATLLRQLGLDACVAHSEQDYVARAVAVAADLDRLARWRKEMRDRLAAGESFNAERFTRSLENAFRDMWAGWCGRAIE
jgi:protein O-GlcNAc transferase